MSAGKTVLRIIVFVAVTATIGVWLIGTKSSFLGPMVGSCPAAYNGLLNLMQSVQSNSSGLIDSVWACGVGVLLYLGLPGIGIGWIISKHV